MSEYVLNKSIKKQTKLVNNIIDYYYIIIICLIIYYRCYIENTEYIEVSKLLL